MDEDDFFEGDARPIYRAALTAVEAIGAARIRVSKSQIGFSRAHPFAAVWKPGQYLRGDGPPLVLSIYLRRRDPSPRWKDVAEPRPGRFTHHMEVRAADQIDGEVSRWLEEAWREAG